ncbi:hypothetical protein GCM10010524_11020 [Streptomyces mexicanus]
MYSGAAATDASEEASFGAISARTAVAFAPRPTTAGEVITTFRKPGRDETGGRSVEGEAHHTVQREA